MLRRQLIFLAIGLSTLCFVRPPAQAQEASRSTAPTPPTPPKAPTVASSLHDRIEALVEQLGASNYQEREAARWELERIGLAAFERLRVAAERHPSIEVANTARYILESRQVTWHLETDSLEVREILAGYHQLIERERLSRIGLLIKHDTTDAAMALCRIARFDFDRPAKTAALGIIEVLSTDETPAPELVASLRIELGNGDRPSVLWVKQALADLASEVDVDAWRELAIAEVESPKPANDMGESRQLALSFCTRISFWINYHSGNETSAIDFARPHLRLVRQNKYEMDRFARSLLDKLNAPRLVVYLREVHREKFDLYPDLLYLLAESHRRLGEEDLAKQFAEQASELLGNPSEETKAISLRNDLELDELVASNRFQVAENLENRGMFDWAKTEYFKTLEFKSRFDSRARMRFSEFLWSLGEYRQAADVLRSVAESYMDEDGNPLQPTNPAEQLSKYHYFEGLALAAEGKPEEGWQNLMRAFEQMTVDFEKSDLVDFDLPDVIIAMSDAARNTPQFQSRYKQAFDRVVSRLRDDVIRSEDALSRAPNRELRRQQESNLANACNQLAWLLSKCQTNQTEAVSLSRRAVELLPREAMFLDTLGRAYFSAGQVTEAIEAQERAVRLAPNDPQLRRQLEEFKANSSAN